MSEAGDLSHLSEVDGSTTNSESKEKQDICEDGSIITADGSGDVGGSASVTEPESDPQNENLCIDVDVANLPDLDNVVTETAPETGGNIPCKVTGEAIEGLLPDEQQNCEHQQDTPQKLADFMIDDDAAIKQVESSDRNETLSEEQLKEPDLVIHVDASCSDETVQEAHPSETNEPDTVIDASCSDETVQEAHPSETNEPEVIVIDASCSDETVQEAHPSETNEPDIVIDASCSDETVQEAQPSETNEPDTVIDASCSDETVQEAQPSETNEPDIVIDASCSDETVQEAQPSETRSDFEDVNNTGNDHDPNVVSDQSNNVSVGERDFMTNIDNDVVPLTEVSNAVNIVEGSNLCEESSEKQLEPACENVYTPDSNPDNILEKEIKSEYLSSNETDEKETAVKTDENLEKRNEPDIEVVNIQTEEASLADNTEEINLVIEAESLPEDSKSEKSITLEKESEPISVTDKNDFPCVVHVSESAEKKESNDINLCKDVKSDEKFPKSVSKDILKEKGTPEKVKFVSEKKTMDVKKDSSARTPDKSTKSTKEKVVKEKIGKRDSSEYKVDDELAKANKSNNSAVRGSPNLNSKPFPSRDSKPPSKQRYSEQRQRKTASRATDRQEKKDGSTADRQDRKDSSKGKDFSPSRRKDQSASVQTASTVVKPNAPTAAELEAKWQQEEVEKKQREEEERKEEERLKEEKRIADEKQKAEEEERRKIEEAEQQLKDELKTLEDYISDANEKRQIKSDLRGKNISASGNRPDESFFSRLDSSLKKNTAFVKKLKNLTESQKDSLVKDFLNLNLSKYIGECATGLAEAKLKMSDVSCGVILSSLFHQRYAEFSPAILESFQKFLLNKKDEKIPNPSKYRVDLRFFAELLSVRVFSQKEGLPILANQLSVLVNNDKDGHNNLSTISSFCKHCGDDYAGLVPRRIRELSEKHNQEIPKSGMLPPERQKACRNLLKDYYQTLCKHLAKDHKGLKALERHNLRMLQTKGELSTEKKELYETSLGAYHKLYINTGTLSDLLDEEMPDLPEEDFKQDPEMAAFDVFNPLRNSEYQYDGDTNLFEDEETRTFYENLPDLKAFIPGILYKESEQGTSKDAITDTPAGQEEENLAVEDVEKEMETENSLAEIEQQAQQEDVDNPIEEEEDLPPQVHINDEDDVGETVSLMRSQFEAYLQSLPNCVNRELIDKAAIEFCMNFNTKSNRKKLVKALFTVHRTRYDLLPFYSRYVATLYPCMPDVANDLAQLIKSDFKWHVRKKDQINIESKLKTVRFMGELVKFNMFPKSESLHCVKTLMFDFRHHNIEMACSLLEACGRYLYRSPESHHRTKVYLDVMMRKKTALHLDGRYTTMIENAYYYSNPPDTPQMVHKERPPMHEYIRKLLYKDLSKTMTEKVLRQLRKLDWDNEQVAFYATKCLTSVWHVRYNSVHCVANTLAGLAPYHEMVAIHVVDGVMEDIRIGMEINHPKYNQRRVSGVKYLGELYNFRMVESAVIFKTLYSFISFGISLDESMPSPLDPPEHLFRLRLVCVLLDTCGQYFDKGSSKKKLDYFLVYFQRYYWFKRSNSLWCETRPFPIDQMNMVQDTLEMIRPKLKMHVDFEAASKAAEELGNEFKAKVAKALPKPETRDSGDGVQFMDPGLTTIQETDEMDELSQGYSQTPLTDDGPSTADSQTSTDGHTGSQPYEGDRRRTTAEEEDDVLDSAGEEETDDQVAVLPGGPKFVTSSEDDDFMAAFDKMMVDNIKARNSESLKVPQLDIAVPMHLKGQKKTFIPQQEQGSINFVLMTRKGNKQFPILNVPISEEFAAKFKEREKVEKAEKERMKQVVLDIHERQEEEDYQEMIASMSRPATTNTNRERRVRYNHPKGAPDADLIFGSKKR